MTFLQHLIENFWDFDQEQLSKSSAKRDQSADSAIERNMSNVDLADFIIANQSSLPTFTDARIEEDLERLQVYFTNLYNRMKRSRRTDLGRTQDKYNRVIDALELIHDEMTRRARQKRQAALKRNRAKKLEQLKKDKADLISSTPPPADNPRWLKFNPSPGKPFRIQNPYYKDESYNHEFRYIGHPANYDGWTKYMADYYRELDDILTRNGKPNLSVMYAGKGKSGVSFVVVANDNFVWRNYDPAPGAARNLVIINGRTILASKLTYNKTEEEQDKMVANV